MMTVMKKSRLGLRKFDRHGLRVIKKKGRKAQSINSPDLVQGFASNPSPYVMTTGTKTLFSTAVLQLKDVEDFFCGNLSFVHHVFFAHACKSTTNVYVKCLILYDKRHTLHIQH